MMGIAQSRLANGPCAATVVMALHAHGRGLRQMLEKGFTAAGAFDITVEGLAAYT